MLFGRRKPGFAKPLEEGELNKEGELEILSEEMEELDEVYETDGMQERTQVEMFTNFIRSRSNASYLTSMSSLKEEDENIDELLEQVREHEKCKDIVSIEGEKDVYLYSTKTMSDNYAMIALLAEERNFPKTVAEMVRWNSKTYPSPTPLDYFNRTPYSYTDEEIENAIEIVKKQEEYGDIAEVITSNDVRYLYSTLHMSEKYAKSLAQDVEDGLTGYL